MVGLRTWIEIDKNALRHNVGEFMRIIPKSTRFMAVIKSNAYGHGLILIAKELLALRSFSEGGWFGVDSIVEALRLRQEGIKNPILVLGYTLPERLEDASENDIILSVSTFETFKEILKLKNKPKFHIKIDTGMHRQGFLLKDISRVTKIIQNSEFRIQNLPQGLFTHFAIAKDRGYPTCTLEQFKKFKKAIALFERARFRNLIRHAAASGGAILYPETHLDIVRIGMGLYGYYPSPESKINLESGNFDLPKISLKPVLSWKTVIGEIKEISKGAAVGYDLTEMVPGNTKIAVLPIGYWHGFDRGLSTVGDILVRGKRCRVLGRVSMDMAVIDVTEVKNAKVGDEAVIIGCQGKGEVWADEVSSKIGTSPYEFLTRINPLIERAAV